MAGSSRVLVLTFGTRGDVQPYVALARGLTRAGHEVVIGTGEGFRGLVEGAGVPFAPVGSEMLSLMQSEMPTMTGPGEAMRMVRRMTAAMRTSLTEQWGLARDLDPTMIIYHPKILGGLHVAERLGVPAMVSLPLPFLTPTTAFPMPFLSRSLGERLNSWSYGFNRFSAVMYGGMINDFRQKVLGLPPMSRVTDYLAHADGRPVPVLYPFSKHVVPVPADYPAHAHVTGYWFHDGDHQTPPGDLVDFVDGEDPVIYIGFGSMGFGGRATERGRVVAEAVAWAGVRAVIATGWGGLKVESRSDRIRVVESVPHEWLFDRVDAVVHHGGAGTTAAGLRAGRPTLICPVLGDQGFWGNRVHSLGAGPEPVPLRRITVERLAERLRSLVTDQTYRVAALRVAEGIAAEDGVATAVDVIERIAANPVQAAS